jgi:hypothetical protein
MPTPSLLPFDAVQAAAAFERVKPRLEAVPEHDLGPVRADLRPVVAAALAAHEGALALGERLARLPVQEFDPACPARVADAAWALWHARARLEQASLPKETELPAALADVCVALRDRMLRVCRYYLEDDEAAGPVLAALGRKKVPADLAADLRKLAALYEERRELLSTDTKHWKAEDAAQAEGLAGEIGAVLSEVDDDGVRVWTAQLARAQALLVAEHEELRATLLWMLRKEPGAAERFPQLLSVPAARGRPRKNQGVPSEPPPVRA